MAVAGPLHPAALAVMIELPVQAANVTTPVAGLMVLPDAWRLVASRL